MTIDQVIAQGNIHYNLHLFSWGNWIWWTVIAFFLIIEILIWFASSWDEEVEGGRGAMFFCAMLVFVVFWLISTVNSTNHENQLIEKWKKDVAYPYIQSLPEQQGEIIYIKIEPQIQYTGLLSIGWGYRAITREMLQPLTISYKKDKGIVTQTSWYNADMSLTSNVSPYVKYQVLPRDLGNGVNAGIYYPTVYLPNNYKFTDIK